MATLDEFLNWIIPPLVVLGGLYVLYKPLKGPIDAMFSHIKSFILWIKGKATGEEEIERIQIQFPRSIEYE